MFKPDEKNTMFKLELQNIADLGPCNLDHFHKKAKGALTLEYPNGWQRSDSLRVAKEHPISLLWLVSKRAIPVGFLEANTLLDEVYGKDRASEIRDAFKQAGIDRAKKAKKDQARAAAVEKAKASSHGGFFDALKTFRSPPGEKPARAAAPAKPSPETVFEKIETVARRGGKKSVLGGLLKK